MKHITRPVACAVVTAAVFLGQASAQNVVQADLGSGGGICPQFGQTEFIPGLAVNIRTTGRPVLVTYVIGFNSSPQGNIQIVPVINGVNDIDRQLGRAIGDFLGSGQADTMSFSRVYMMPKGTHDFALTYSCQSSINVVRGWLTVTELPR